MSIDLLWFADVSQFQLPLKIEVLLDMYTTDIQKIFSTEMTIYCAEIRS